MNGWLVDRSGHSCQTVYTGKCYKVDNLSGHWSVISIEIADSLSCALESITLVDLCSSVGIKFDEQTLIPHQNSWFPFLLKIFPESKEEKNSATFQPTWVSEFPWIKDSKFKGGKMCFVLPVIWILKLVTGFLLLMGINYKWNNF